MWLTTLDFFQRIFFPKFEFLDTGWGLSAGVAYNFGFLSKNFFPKFEFLDTGWGLSAGVAYNFGFLSKNFFFQNLSF